MHRFVLRRLGADLADDITAETFATALRHRARYDPARPNARPWLFGIAANLVGKHRRSEVRGLRPSPASAPTPSPHVRTPDGAEERVVASRRPALAAALAKLAPATGTCCSWSPGPT